MKRLPEYAVVRTLIAHSDMKGRAVPPGTVGTIVHSHGSADPPACIVEVVLFNESGIHDDSHIFDALESDLELDSPNTSHQMSSAQIVSEARGEGHKARKAWWRLW